MTLRELGDVERTALAGFLHLLLHTTPCDAGAEAVALGALAEELGHPSLFWEIVEEGRHLPLDIVALKESATAVVRRAAQEFIYEVLFAASLPGTVSEEELAVLEWLASEWKLASAATPFRGPT